MDPIKGAEVLSARVGSAAALRTAEPALLNVPESALPLFHWLGVEPAASVDASRVDGAATPTVGRRSAERPRVRRLLFRARPGL